MIIKEYNDLDTCNRTRLFVDVECEVCGTVFKRQKRLLKAHTCSARCVKLLKGERVVVKCAHCGRDVEKPKSRVEKSKHGYLFCDRKCKEAGQKYIIDIMPDHYYTSESPRNYRDKAFKYYPHECQLCGYKENMAALVVHHIDEDRNNDDIDNLIILCANCHAITHWGQ